MGEDRLELFTAYLNHDGTPGVEFNGEVLDEYGVDIEDLGEVPDIIVASMVALVELLEG